jgi:hypothetical protein
MKSASTVQNLIFSNVSNVDLETGKKCALAVKEAFMSRI